MKKVLRLLKQWTLLIALVTGAVGHSFFSRFTPLTPWLLAAMLLLTFCNISPRDLRFHPLHMLLLSLQVTMGLGLYALLVGWHPAIAQGACMCALTPTATAAAIITGMLGGSVGFLAAYTFISSLAIVVVAPIVLPMIATVQVDASFLDTMANVFMRVGPTMLVPLLLAWFIQYTAPKVNAVLLRWGILSYYIWAMMLIILMAGTFDELLKPGEKLSGAYWRSRLHGQLHTRQRHRVAFPPAHRRRARAGPEKHHPSDVADLPVSRSHRLGLSGLLFRLSEHRQRHPDIPERTPRRPHPRPSARLPRKTASGPRRFAPYDGGRTLCAAFRASQACQTHD